MALSKDKRTRISEVAKLILLSRLESFPNETTKVRNAPFHGAFLECFKDKIRPLNIQTPYLVALASWLHGLNTSLGSGFEEIAHILSGGFKRSFSGPYTLTLKKKQAENIEGIIRELKYGKIKPSLENENKKIFTFSQSDKNIKALPFTADNYIEKNDLIEGIEMKSVRPNSGEGRAEKQKILYAKAAFRLLNPGKSIKFYVGFPFDPTAETPTGYSKERFFNYLIEFKKFFSPDEVLIGSELWDHLSGSTNTMEEMLEVIAQTVKEVNS